ncbi:hypothetical protein MTO96_049363 [Rhipicephalus appendiculatus]
MWVSTFGIKNKNDSPPLPRNPIMAQPPQHTPDDPSADPDQVAAIPIDQRAFCDSLQARDERSNLYSLNRSRHKLFDLWGLGAVAAVGALVLDERKSAAHATNSSKTGKASSFCDTVECQRTAALLEQHLDTTFSPCERLYDHVCTRWRERHAKSSRRRGRYSVDDAILDGYKRKLTRRLSVDDKTRPFRKMRSFFLQCSRNQLTSRHEIDEIRGLLELGNSPSVVALATSIVRLARIGFSPFFDVSVTGYPEDFRVKLFQTGFHFRFTRGPCS